MFGLFCKGLHCAGCGKGIPASVILILVVIGALNNGRIAHAIANAMIIIAISVAFAAIGSVVMISVIMAKGNILGGRWEGPTMTQQKAIADQEREWPNIRALPRDNPFYDPIGKAEEVANNGGHVELIS